uniref:SWIB domain-containing protein n=1 Tax=Rhabditophanes sp. KR3021 TaxID=114890 RepID=A0AC35TZ57_9BILA
MKKKFKFDFNPHKKVVDELTLNVIKSLDQKSAASSKKEKEESSDESSEDEGPLDRDIIKRKTKGKKGEGSGSKKSSTKDSSPAEDVFDDEDMATAIKRRRAAASTKKNGKKGAPVSGKKRAAPAGITKILMVSDEVFTVTQKRYMRRSDIVKYMYSYFKENDLLDPTDRRMVLSDDALFKITGEKRFQAFGLMKLMKNHVKDAEDLDEETKFDILRDLGVDQEALDEAFKKKEKEKKKSETATPRKGKSVFSRFCVLSDELSDLTGQRYMTRSDVVKFMWTYFKANNLMDPKDKRMVIVDERLKPIFPQKRIQAFVMMKTLKNHVKDPTFLGSEHQEAIMVLLKENEEKAAEDAITVKEEAASTSKIEKVEERAKKVRDSDDSDSDNENENNGFSKIKTQHRWGEEENGAYESSSEEELEIKQPPPKMEVEEEQEDSDNSSSSSSEDEKPLAKKFKPASASMKSSEKCFSESDSDD